MWGGGVKHAGSKGSGPLGLGAKVSPRGLHPAWGRTWMTWSSLVISTASWLLSRAANTELQALWGEERPSGAGTPALWRNSPIVPGVLLQAGCGGL